MRRRRHFHVGHAGGAAGERLIDEPCDDGRDKAFEPDPSTVDRFLMRIHDFGNRLRLHADEPAVQRSGIDRGRGSAGRLLIHRTDLGDDCFFVEALVADLRVVDAILICRDHSADGAQYGRP